MFSCWTTFNISCKGGLAVMNSLSFCLSGNVFRFRFWRTVFLGIVFLVGSLPAPHPTPFSTLTILSHSLLAYKISGEKANGGLTGVSLYMVSHFSFSALKISSSYLSFNIVIIMCLGVIFLGSLLLGSFQFPVPWCVDLSQDLVNLGYYFFK